MFVVTVTFDVKPECREAFLPVMLANAKTSLNEEPDCHQFDVCIDPNRPNSVFLYELFTDRAAFDDHLSSAHFKSFDAKVADMITGKEVALFERVAA